MEKSLWVLLILRNLQWKYRKKIVCHRAAVLWKDRWRAKRKSGDESKANCVKVWPVSKHFNKIFGIRQTERLEGLEKVSQSFEAIRSVSNQSEAYLSFWNFT